MEMHEVCERALELSKADDCIVIGRRRSDANVRWANNTTTTNGTTQSQSLSIVSVIGRRVGSVTRSYFPADRLEDFVRESERACEDKPEAQDHMPLPSPESPGAAAAGDWRAPAEETSIGVFEPLTPQLADMFRRADAAKLKTFGYAEHSMETVWLATSAGVRARSAHGEGKIDFTGKTADFKRSSWAGQATATFGDVDVGALYRAIGERLEWSENEIAMPAGRYEVLLSPSCVADLVIYMYGSMSARDADEGRTVFSKPGGGNRIGEKMCAGGVTLYSDPNEPGMELPPFEIASASSSNSSVFDNGAPIERVEWMRDGVLQNLVRTRHWAAKTGAPPVMDISNVVFPASGPTLDEMIAKTERALLVTCLWYIRTVDPQKLLLTGLTRDGVFLVEGGEVKGAVNNFRWNMSPVHAFANIVEIGACARSVAREFDEYGHTKTPPARIAEFNMSSVSEAT